MSHDSRIAWTAVFLLLAQSGLLCAQPPLEGHQGEERIVDEFFRALKNEDAATVSRLCDYCRQRMELSFKYQLQDELGQGEREVEPPLARILDIDFFSHASTWKIAKWPGDRSPSVFVVVSHPDPTQAPVEREGPQKGLLVRSAAYDVEVDTDDKVTGIRRFRPDYWTTADLPVRIVQITTFTTSSIFDERETDLDYFAASVIGDASAIHMTCGGVAIETQRGGAMRVTADQSGLRHFVLTLPASALSEQRMSYPADCLAEATTPVSTRDVVAFVLEHSPAEDCWVRAPWIERGEFFPTSPFPPMIVQDSREMCDTLEPVGKQ